MTLRIDRRRLILTGSLGLGAWAIPGFAQTVPPPLPGFTHSVASGEPGPDSVLLWTRYLPLKGDSARLVAQISETADFARIVASAETVTGPWRDYTVKVVLTGLKPGTRYFYRFVTADGAKTSSPIGRTRTLPEGRTDRFTIATFSCSNIGFGFFNAYAHAAARDDIDLALHVGDYFYEHGPNQYPDAAHVIAARLPEPQHEIVALTDYRLRYAAYRSDPDLQALHAAKPMIAQWDDHESANDSWEGGAQNHQAGEGDWLTRKAAAIQAFREWMPVSDNYWSSYAIGDLATLYRTDTRLSARSRQPAAEVEAALRSGDPQALIAFRDGAWLDPARTMMGSEQEAWLARGFAASARAGTRWQVAAIGTNMGFTSAPPQLLDWLPADASQQVRLGTMAAAAASKIGLPMEIDNWGGYPAARARFLKAAQAAGANLLLLTGDSHNAWAYDLAQDGKPAGVEFGGQAVTSPGYEDYYPVPGATIGAALVARNSELKWCDIQHRGYMATVLTPERATNDWVFLDTVAQRSTAAKVGYSATVVRGRNVMG